MLRLRRINTRPNMKMLFFLCLIFIIWPFKELTGNDDISSLEFYPKPANCHPTQFDGPDPNDIYLTCNLDAVNKEVDFDLIVARRLLGFCINCTSPHETSNLTPGAIAHLHFLQELSFVACRFSDLPPDTLKSFTQLGTLIIADAHPDRQDPSPGLRLPDEFLINNPNLLIVHLKNNAIESLPNDWFCSSPLIMFVSLPGNRFQSLANIGCGKDNACCRSVQALNLSQNAITEVRKMQLEPLAEIMYLDLRHNAIDLIDGNAFNTMLKLVVLDLSYNQIIFIPPGILQKNVRLQQLFIAGNQIAVLPPEFCCGRLPFLTMFGIAENNLTVLPAGVFNHSNDLFVVDFSNNPLQSIPEQFFDVVYNVSSLYLHNCQIEHLPDESFKNMNSLETLLLMNNRLKLVSSGMLQGLGKLQHLNMSRNTISFIHKEAFSHCPLLQYLDLGSNQLTSFPRLPVLNMEFVILSHNLISEIDTGNVSTVTSLKNIDLSNNRLQSINSVLCSSKQTKLAYLDLSYNRIYKINPMAFRACTALDKLLLNHNNFVQFDRRITNSIPSLRMLDLSNNHLQYFDYNVVPDALLHLDINHNQLEELHDVQHGVGRLQMKTMSAHYNRITSLNNLPMKIQVVDLSHNDIEQISNNVFSVLVDLIVADLSFNRLTDLKQEAFQLKPSRTLSQSLPKVILKENWPNCTCLLKWLVHDYVPGMRDYVEIIPPYYCIATHERVRQFQIRINLQSKSELLDATLLCPYENNLNLKQPCPKACSCYHDFSQNYFDIDCGNKTWDSHFQIELPTLARRLFLDGNKNLQIAASSILRNASQLKTLYMNGSWIENLNNIEFTGLPELEELHLENNFISAISGTEFYELLQLRKLFLHDNRVATVNMQAFSNLKHLQVLTLHNNKLHALDTWWTIKATFDVTLRGNQFECTCDFQGTIQLWARKIDDLNQIECLDRGTNTNFSAYNSTYCQEDNILSEANDETTIILAAVAGLLFLMMSIVLFMYIYRLEMQVWLYSRYGVRFFHRNRAQDENKLFDAFISYSSDDDEFVAYELVPRLERELHFRLCVHQRDFPVGGFIADTIVEAVEKSCRTVMVLTQNFVKSEWCRFEFKMAHHRSMQDRCCRLIVIILEDVDPALMDKELRLYLQTNTYLRWDDRLFWEKLLYSMPDRQQLQTEL